MIWRIIPGAATVERTIPVGFGATEVAFGDGAIWTTNLANGTVSRIDPRTNDVTATRQLAGTPQALAAGGGSAWVSVAGATSSGSLPQSDCGPVEPPGAAAKGMYLSDSLVTAESLTSAGKRLLSAFEKTQPGGAVPSGTYLPEGLEAAQIVVDAIAHSDGSRASVLRQLRLSKLSAGLFGGFHFDRDGDITPGPFTIFRITGGRGTPGLAPEYRGSVVDRTIRVPTGLLDTVPTASRRHVRAARSRTQR